MLSSNGLICRICFDIIWPRDLTISPPTECLISFKHRAQMCKCKNLGVIFDEDLHARVYVDDITTVQRCILFHTEDFEPVRHILLSSFQKALYVDTLNFKSTPILFKPKAPKNNYVRVTSTKYNKNLIKALDRYKHETSDGTEEFLRTSLNDPLKGD